MGDRRAGMLGTSLKGKVVLLVSVAEDLGYELGTSLAKHGCRIVLAGRSSQIRTASDSIKALGYGSEAVGEVELDVRGGEASIDASVGQAWDIFGTIDVLLYCSAVPGALKSPLDHTESDWDETMTVNLKAPWLVARAVAQRMKSSEKLGSILFVSYISGLDRGFTPGVSVHGTALAGLHQLTKFMGMELGKYGIMVAAVARGLSKTDPLLASRSEQQMQEAAKKMPLNRWTHPVRDIEGLIAFLASDNAHYSTSSIFIADGGQSLPRPRMKSYL
ncbi:hypothetical protein M758_1G069100 [Ceratodon purpureus]|nr:hypothetical protein M758_1G069100 [Ceratodon purpureus]